MKITIQQKCLSLDRNKGRIFISGDYQTVRIGIPSMVQQTLACHQYSSLINICISTLQFTTHNPFMCNMMYSFIAMFLRLLVQDTVKS